jgi:hypothetical protein
MDDGVRAEIACLAAIRDGKLAFLRDILAHATAYRAANPVRGRDALDPDEVAALRLEGVEQMAEFLYMMDATGLNRDPVGLRRFLDRHNADLAARIADLRAAGRGYTPGGLSVQRLEKGILDRAQVEALVAEAADQGLRYDQSTLGALLIEAMALESARTLIILLGNTGFLLRRGSGTKTIRSTGALEAAFRRQLRHLIAAIRPDDAAAQGAA